MIHCRPHCSTVAMVEGTSDCKSCCIGNFTTCSSEPAVAAGFIPRCAILSLIDCIQSQVGEQSNYFAAAAAASVAAAVAASVSEGNGLGQRPRLEASFETIHVVHKKTAFIYTHKCACASVYICVGASGIVCVRARTTTMVFE